MWTAVTGKRDIAEVLLQNSAYVNAKDEKGHTSLICAAKNGNRDTAELLL